MATPGDNPDFGAASSLAPLAPAIIFVAGWLVLFGPVYVDFAQTEWRRDENAHAPFIMAIAIAAAYARITGAGLALKASGGDAVYGLLLMAAGLLVFAVGKAGEATLFVSAAQGLVAGGAALAFFGAAGLRALWFPLVMCAYLVIWPGWAVDALTAPLKQAIAASVSDALYAAGLPVAHAGAVITAGPYQLLVADACSGLNSLIALTAVGAVYLYVAKRRSRAVNLAVALSLAPIAVIANVARVALLVLLTYFFGYDAGQGFLHEGAGLVMFSIALGGVFAVDAIAARIWEPAP